MSIVKKVFLTVEKSFFFNCKKEINLMTQKMFFLSINKKYFLYQKKRSIRKNSFYFHTCK